MDVFIKETKHRPHQLETEDDMNLITKKFLCTQVPTFVEYEKIYPFVSDDMESIDFRAPNVLSNYRNYSIIHPELLSNLLESAEYEEAKKMPVFNDYVEKVKPPKGKEVLTFFLHGQRKKNLESHINAMVEDFDERKRLYNAIQTYQVPTNMNYMDVVQSLGQFMLNFKPTLYGPYTSIENNENEGGEEEEEEEEEAEIQKKVHLTTPVKLEWNEQEHWENPILKQFKEDAGLSTKFSCKKAYKQMIVSSCAPNHIHLVSDLRGKYQNDEIPRISSVDLPIHYVDYISSENIEKMVESPEAQNLYHGMLVKPKDNREWVKSLLLMNHPESKKFVQVSKHYKSENLTPEIIELFIEK